MRIHCMGDAEINNLYRVIFHHKNVARFQIAMDQAALMRGLKSATGLRDDIYDTFNRQTMTGITDQLIQSFAGQQGHYKKRFLVTGFVLKFPNIENLNNVGVRHGLQHFALFVEELERHLVGELEQGLEGNVTVHRRGIVAAVDNTHAAFTQLGLDLVPALNFFYSCHAYLTFPGERIEGFANYNVTSPLPNGRVHPADVSVNGCAKNPVQAVLLSALRRPEVVA